jgi:hypothetical protein
MLKMEHLCVVCAVERVMAASLKLELLNLENLVVNTLQNCHFGIQCFMVSFLANLVLVLTLKLLEEIYVFRVSYL